MALADKQMVLVAEIGLNHDGNFDLAYELIRQARMAGAELAKFQFGWRCNPGEINQIDEKQARQLKAWCEGIGIEMLASLITEEGLALAQGIGLQRYKIASRTVVDNPALCERILSEGKPTYVSLGMWDRPGFPFGQPDAHRLHYIYCRSKYPTYPSDLTDFPPLFGSDGYYGYSDHCHGIAACLLAAARGARYIEKHFTLNKTSQVIRDHILSATPDEFRLLTTLGPELSMMAEATLNNLSGVARNL